MRWRSEWPDRRTIDAEFGRVRRAFAAAARPHAVDGWKVDSSRMVRRSADGSWATFQAEATGPRGALEGIWRRGSGPPAC